MEAVTESKTDELQEAWDQKFRLIDKFGRKTLLRKWPYQRGLDHTAKLITTVQGMGKSTQDIMRAGMDKVLVAAGESLTQMLLDSVVVDPAREGGFRDAESAKTWLDDLAMDEVLKLLQIILEMNIRPLVESAGEIKAALGEKLKKN